MDNDFRLDLDEIRAVIAKAEVLTIFFPLLGKALLLDTRSGSGEGPLVQTVPMVASVEERVRSLERLRPRLGRPQGIVAVPWFRRVGSMRDLGIVAALCERVLQAGGAPIDCEAAFGELLRIERQQLKAAVSGREYQTLWRRE